MKNEKNKVIKQVAITGLSIPLALGISAASVYAEENTNTEEIVEQTETVYQDEEDAQPVDDLIVEGKTNEVGKIQESENQGSEDPEVVVQNEEMEVEPVTDYAVELYNRQTGERKKYTTLQEAIDSIEEHGASDIALLRDVTEDIVVKNKVVSIYLRGFTLSGTGKTSVITAIKDPYDDFDHSCQVNIDGQSNDIFETTGIGKITGGSNEYGGAVYQNGGGLNFDNVEICGNHASKDGGAIYSINGSVAASGIYIHDNTADGNGGALYVDGSLFIQRPNKNDLNYNRICNNTAKQNGGGVYLKNTYANFYIVDIYDNTAQIGGGVYNESGTAKIDPWRGDSSDEITNVYNNSASIEADDIYNAEGATLEIKKVANNYPLKSCGHAIDGWYDDSEGNRWNAHGKQHTVELELGEYISSFSYQLSLKAAHVANTQTGTVTIRYLDESGNQLHEDDIMYGDVGTVYTTTPKEIDKYTLKITPDNATGTYSETDTVVTYVYAKNKETGTVTTKFVDEEGNSIAENVVITGEVDSEYTTTPIEIDKYTLKETPSNATGKISKQDTVVTYIYEKKKGTVIVHYQDQSGNKLAEDETLSDELDKEYSTEAKTIDKYTLVSTPENASGTYTSDSIEVTYVYAKKKGTVTTKFVDEKNNSIADDVVTTGEVDSSYTTTPKEIEKYTLKETPANASGTYSESDTVVTYVYSKNKGTVIVHYQDQSGNKLAEDETLSDELDKEYTTTAKVIDKYTLVSEPENASGIYTSDSIEVTYVYAKKKGTLVVHYYDDNNNKLTDDIVYTADVDSEYTTGQKAFDGYTFDKVVGKTSGTLSEEGVEVTYFYKKNSTPETPEQPNTPKEDSKSDTSDSTSSKTDASSKKTNSVKTSVQTSISSMLSLLGASIAGFILLKKKDDE